jgi:transcriptional regulator GlxA family with amidase domain
MRIPANRSKPRLTQRAVPHRVVILVFDQAQMLDVAGPADVFTMANRLSTAVHYTVVCATPQGGLTALSNGLAVQTQAISEIRPSTVGTLIVAGAEAKGLWAAMQNEALKTWVLQVAAKAKRIASVCVGSFALAHWGLLDGKRATSHWAAVDRLQKHYPAVQVDRQAIFVQDGAIWTAGGVTTGIDLALAMLQADSSRHVAAQVASLLLLTHRRLGNQAQHSSELQAQAGPYAALIEWMKTKLQTKLTIAELAAQAHESERSFCRRFVQETGQTPASFVQELRLATAKRALEGGQSVKSAARLAGFTSQEHLSRTFRRRLEMTPQHFRGLYAPWPSEAG